MGNALSVRGFFIQMPVELLEEYFSRLEQKKVEITGQTNADKLSALLAYWNALPENKKKEAEGNFSDIQSMWDEGGIFQLQQVARRKGKEKELLDRWTDNTLEVKAFISFLYFPEWWQEAESMAFMDRVTETNWKKQKNLPPLLLNVSEQACQVLSHKLSVYFVREEGRGHHCSTELYQRDSLYCFFVYLEDIAHSTLEFNQDGLTTRPFRQALRLIFQYDAKEETLSLYCRGLSKHTRKLQEIFSSVILGMDELPNYEKDRRVYNLEPLANPDFEFHYDPDWGIESVELLKLRLTQKLFSRRVVFEAAKGGTKDDVYEQLKSWLEVKNLDDFHVTQAEIRVTYRQGDERLRTLRFTITWPNSCCLSSNGIEGRLQQMLKMSGIELREPKDYGAAA